MSTNGVISDGLQLRSRVTDHRATLAKLSGTYTNAVRKGLTTTADLTFFKSIRQLTQMDKFDRPYQQHTWIYATNNVIAINLSSVPWEIREGTRKNNRVVEDPKNPLVRLFEQPNPTMTRSQLWEAYAIQLGLSGESIWVKLDDFGKPVENKNQMPSELWPLPGSFFGHEVSETTKDIEKWVLNDPQSGQRIDYLPHQLIHFKLWNPHDYHRGMSPLIVATTPARQDFKAGQWNESTFDNGGEPGGVIQTPEDLDPTQKRALLKNWEQRFSGAENKGRTALLSGGAQFVSFASTQRDMEFLGQRQWSRTEILAIYMVNPFELGIVEDVNRATAIASKRQLFESNLIPKMTYIEDVLRPEIRVWSDGSFFGEFDTSQIEALQPNFNEKLEQAERLSRLGYPIDLVNERLDLGMKELPNGLGKIPLVSAVLVPLDAVAGDLPPDPEFPEATGGTPTEDASEDDPFASEPADDATVAPELESAERSIRKVGDKADPLEVFGGWLGLLKRAFLPGERDFRKRFKKHFFLLRREQLKLFTKAVKDKEKEEGKSFGDWTDYVARQALTPGDIEAILFNLEKWNERLQNSTRPAFKSTAGDAVKLLEQELGSLQFFDAQDPEVLKFLTEKEIKVTRINVTLKRRLRSSLLRGMANRETIGELQKRIVREFRFANARSLSIARTETAQTLNTTRFMGFGREGIAEHEWVTAGDDEVRETHRINGEVVPIGTPFSNGLLHPSEIGAPAGEVVNCRCVAVAVVS